jgi:hypothetical protein
MSNLKTSVTIPGMVMSGSKGHLANNGTTILECHWPHSKDNS